MSQALEPVEPIVSLVMPLAHMHSPCVQCIRSHAHVAHTCCCRCQANHTVLLTVDSPCTNVILRDTVGQSLHSIGTPLFPQYLRTSGTSSPQLRSLLPIRVHSLRRHHRPCQLPGLCLHKQLLTRRHDCGDRPRHCSGSLFLSRGTVAATKQHNRVRGWRDRVRRQLQ